MYVVFPHEDISSGELYLVYARIGELPVLLCDPGAIYQYECTFVCRIPYHFHDESYIGTDLSDEI